MALGPDTHVDHTHALLDRQTTCACAQVNLTPNIPFMTAFSNSNTSQRRPSSSEPSGISRCGQRTGPSPLMAHRTTPGLQIRETEAPSRNPGHGADCPMKATSRGAASWESPAYRRLAAGSNGSRRASTRLSRTSHTPKAPLLKLSKHSLLSDADPLPRYKSRNV